MEAKKLVGENVRFLREERRLSLSELTRRSGVAKATLSGLEQGNGNPTLDTLEALAEGLEVDILTLFDLDRTPRPSLEERISRVERILLAALDAVPPTPPGSDQ